ncbi:hypothetical protein Ddye_007501 [Dipteronia dyeriana]|uniref:RNase H type-1 domain-containing protein n=1 Tax=Dipteronia dyeriana TaxID=168575 RepID=A0AAD9XL59_9ROSI|nr:hypothetical protein Ddye_007501 [Dipteronia dyeriana]
MFRIGTGLRINFQKSCVIRMGKSGSRKEWWGATFNCKKAVLPINHLGLPLGAKSRLKTFWNPLVNHIEQRLAPWKRKFLNKGGMLVLINLVWGWKDVNNGSTFFKALSNLFDDNTVTSRIIKDGLKIVTGNGSRAVFWDLTGGDSIQLKIACSRIFALAVKKSDVIQDFESLPGSRWSWEIALRGPLIDWEKSRWEVLLSFLDNIKVRRMASDSLSIWEARNLRTFNGTLNSVDQVADLVKESCVDWKPVKFSKGEAWFSPTSSSLKFNVDGSSRGNPGEGSVGGVLRDHTGKMLGLFSEFVGTLDSITVEILALHKAVSLCSNSPFFYVQEVDFINDSRV